MGRFVVGVSLAIAVTLGWACGGGNAGRPTLPPPEYEEPAPMASGAPGPSAAPAPGASATPAPADAPLSTLPYTPSLDPAAMDKSADPCVDFYQYSCGGWIKHNPLPADQPRWDVYSKLSDENQHFLWGILLEDAQPRAERTPVQQKIGDYFAACMDEAAIESRGAAPLKPTLDAIAAVATVHDLAPLVARLQLGSLGSYTRHMLFAFGSEQDFDDSSKMIAVARAGGLGLPDRDYYTKTDARSEDMRQKYVAHVGRMLGLLGDAPEVAAREAGTIMGIETRLAQASLTRVERRDPHKVFHKMTREKLQATTPSFDWPAFLAAVGASKVTTLNVAEPAFYKQLETELKTVPLDDWKAYLRWHAAHAMAPYLSTPFVQEDFDFYSHTLRGVPVNKPRWKRCVQWTDRQLGEALGQEFV
ncbi:MAG TPA: M13 family metallopeptidase N-terminal domain-containing protein, partial [Polyangiaceae bacterium]